MEKQINENYRNGWEYPFYFALNQILDGIVDDKTKYLWTYKKTNAKNDVCLQR